MPHQRDFVEAMHKAGKPAILHMCGHVLALLDLIRETGCDGIHALTPPPTGNTPWEKALDVIDEDLVIIGCLDPTIWISGKIEEIGPTLDRIGHAADPRGKLRAGSVCRRHSGPARTI